MTYLNSCRRKPILTEHQKQIRFLTGLLMGICALFAAAFFWLVSRPGFIPRWF